MPFEILQVTAAYSNAVLVAIMPHISNFAKTLDLPIHQPVTLAQVQKFGCSPRADHIGGRVILTNDYSFTFDLGAVVLYRSPHSYYSLQNPERLPEFYGTVKVKKDEAISIAHSTLKKLGYTDSELHLDLKPKVTPPKRNEGKEIARYLVEWIDPEQVTTGGIPLERTAVEIDASTGKIEMLGIQTKRARRPDPILDVKPAVIAAKPESQPAGDGTKIQMPNAAYSNAFLVAALPQVSEFIKKAGFEVKVPVTISDVDGAHSVMGFVNNDPNIFCYLKSGDRFVYSHGQVILYDTHDSYRIPAPNSPSEDKPHVSFYGPVNVSASEALSVVTKAIGQLGWATLPELRKRPEIVPPRKEGTNYFSRYFFNWWGRNGDGQIAVAEVDAVTKKLKSLCIDERVNPKIWREPPKINVPLTFDTNTPPPKPSQSARELPTPSVPPATPIK